MASEAEKMLLSTLGAIPGMYKTYYQTNPEVPGFYNPENDLAQQYNQLRVQKMQQEVDQQKTSQAAYKAGGLEAVRDQLLLQGDEMGASRVQSMINAQNAAEQPQFFDGGRLMYKNGQTMQNPGWTPGPTSAGKAPDMVRMMRLDEKGNVSEAKAVRDQSTEWQQLVSQGWVEGKSNPEHKMGGVELIQALLNMTGGAQAPSTSVPGFRPKR